MLTLALQIFVILGLLFIAYIGIVAHRAYTADPTENVRMMDEAKSGILSCAKQIKKVFSTENCDRGR